MSVEIALFNALKSLVANRVYPDIAPELTKLPFITFQQIGGQSLNFLNAALPGKRNSRFQVNVWADSRLDAADLARKIDETVRQVSELQTTVQSEPVALYEPETQRYGTRQDFSFWFG